MSARRFLVIGCIIGASICPSIADAAQMYGNIILNITGGFRVPVTQGGTVKCSGVVVLAPDTSASPSIGALSAALLFNSGINSASKAGTVAAGGQTFSCQVVVPYNFNNIVGNQQIVIAYSVVANDPGFFNGMVFVSGTNPGKTYQVVKIQSIPANGATTTVPLLVYL